jgi:LuxR family transcriptional regulator, regulator of acetate metabolism
MGVELPPASGAGSSVLHDYRRLADEFGGALTELGQGRLLDLHAAERGLVEDLLARFVLGAERGRIAMRRLREIGPPSELLEIAPYEAAYTAELDRVVLSRVQNGYLFAESVHITGDPRAGQVLLARLQDAPVKLDYPLVEWEVMRRGWPILARVHEEEEPLGRHAHQAIMKWRDYVTAPLVLEGRVVGFLHGDTAISGRPLTDVNRDALSMFAVAFPAVYELAVLRHRLRIQRQEMRQIASWADTRTSELSDRAITLNPDDDRENVSVPSYELPSTVPPSNLTRREVEVLELMVKGESNGQIAQQLFVSEGTIKFHVKNILRKMGARNRSELTAQYLRQALNGQEPAALTPGHPHESAHGARNHAMG